MELGEMLGANAFRYWKSYGGTQDVFVGNPEGQPFIVRASEPHWIPLNVLIWAADEKDAEERVLYGLKEALEKTQSEYEPERLEKLIELMEKPGAVKVEPYDTKYVCIVNWDSRGRG
jgi:hypothetical protein